MEREALQHQNKRTQNIENVYIRGQINKTAR